MKAKSIASSLVVSALLACAMVAPAMAQHANDRDIGQAQQEIRARIDRGIASGQITQNEAQNLYRQEREIQSREAMMKRDGIVHPEERWQLYQDLDNMRTDVDWKLSNRRIAEPYRAPAFGFDRHQDRIHARIERGIHTGYITRDEANRLFAQEYRVQRREAYFKSDGYLSLEERHELHREVAMLNDNVDRMLTNDRRYWYGR